MADVVVRCVRQSDVKRIAEIETECFPEAEAASHEIFRKRIAAFPEYFLVAESEGDLVGFINGCATDSSVIYDEMFRDNHHHAPDAANLTVFGLDVVSQCRRQGIAATLMEHFIQTARNAGKKNVILTCKEHLLRYYESFGFVNDGRSESQHGGAQWFDMTLRL